MTTILLVLLVLAVVGLIACMSALFEGHNKIARRLTQTERAVILHARTIDSHSKKLAEDRLARLTIRGRK